ncbi:MAG TPA: peptidoglycan-binding protein [Candidatus Tectomicrobia bacterium]|nr:peptidoglycan-binding protein [Candidatus Tectomicrobia bacterium]
MKRLTTIGLAIALGLAWTAAPAIAQDATKKDAERKADQVEKQAERKADQIERDAKRKAGEVRKQGDAEADRIRGKSGDSVGDKLDRAWEKTKAKAKDTMNGDGAAQGDVRAAQRALQAKGYNAGPIDGVMGPRTSAALREFQEKEKLAVTGQLDAETRARLMASGRSSDASPTESAGVRTRR